MLIIITVDGRPRFSILPPLTSCFTMTNEAIIIYLSLFTFFENKLSKFSNSLKIIRNFLRGQKEHSHFYVLIPAWFNKNDSISVDNCVIYKYVTKSILVHCLMPREYFSLLEYVYIVVLIEIWPVLTFLLLHTRIKGCRIMKCVAKWSNCAANSV